MKNLFFFFRFHTSIIPFLNIKSRFIPEKFSSCSSTSPSNLRFKPQTGLSGLSALKTVLGDHDDSHPSYFWNESDKYIRYNSIGNLYICKKSALSLV